MFARIARSEIYFMPTISHTLILGLLYTYSYLILFPLVVVEGPVVTLIAGFLVSTKFMAFVPAYATVVFADLAGDFLYYSIGRWWFNSFIHGFFSFLKTDLKKINKLKKTINFHKGKILFFGKLSHAIGAPILISAGLAGVPIKEFLWFNFLATLPKSLLLLMVGYYFGSAFDSLTKYLHNTMLWLILGTAVLIFLYIVIARLASNIMSKFEK